MAVLPSRQSLQELRMYRWFAALIVLVLSSLSPAQTTVPRGGVKPRVAIDEIKGKLVVDQWDAVFLQGAKAGYVHTTVVESNIQQGQTLLRTTVDMQLTVKRFNQVLQLQA